MALNTEVASTRKLPPSSGPWPTSLPDQSLSTSDRSLSRPSCRVGLPPWHTQQCTPTHPASSWRTRLPAPTMVSVGDGAGMFSFWLTCAAPGRTKASRTKPLKSVAASGAGETCLASPNARSFPQSGSSRVSGAGNCARGAQPSKECGRTGR